MPRLTGAVKGTHVFESAYGKQDLIEFAIIKAIPAEPSSSYGDGMASLPGYQIIVTKSLFSTLDGHVHDVMVIRWCVDKFYLCHRGQGYGEGQVRKI